MFKILILITGILVVSLQADIRVAINQNGYFDTYGIKEVAFIGDNKQVMTYDEFIKKSTNCKKYEVLGMSSRKGAWEKIMIDCKD